MVVGSDSLEMNYQANLVAYLALLKISILMYTLKLTSPGLPLMLLDM